MSVGIAVSKCWRKTTFDGRRHLMEDDLWQKTTFDGRRHLMEDDIWRKTTFDGRQPLTEDDLWRKTTFEGRRPLAENNLSRKTTFDGRQPLTEDLQWKTTFDGRRLIIERFRDSALPYTALAVIFFNRAISRGDCAPKNRMFSFKLKPWNFLGKSFTVLGKNQGKFDFAIWKVGFAI